MYVFTLKSDLFMVHFCVFLLSV